jgi:putative oxidoreductase
MDKTTTTMEHPLPWTAGTAAAAPAKGGAIMQAPTAITAVTDLAERVGRAFAWLSPVLARLTVGLVFFQSGWGKLHSLDNVTNFFTELGIPAPYFQARLASGTEFVCGALLLVGLATRFAAVPLVIVMCVAIRTALWDQVTGLGSLVGLSEFAYIALLVWLATDGAGPFSLDHVLWRVTKAGDASSRA